MAMEMMSDIVGLLDEKMRKKREEKKREKRL